MKKALLVTLYGETNFGNRLQNYAMQTTLNNLGYTVDNLVVDKPVQQNTISKGKLFVKIVLISIGINKYISDVAKGKRIEKFLGFRKKYFNDMLYIQRDKVENQDWSDYDIAITGSDQVWHNWSSSETELDFYYLSFIEPSKRVSYAPSFGFSQFPKGDIDAHRRGLEGICALSCREQEGCDLIRELTGLKAQRVLDPTFLLSKEQWSQIAKKPSFSITGKYLLVFFLGEISEDYQREIKRIEAEKRLLIININDPNNPKHYAISPDEFIWLIQHAEIVCTDSFHCTAFCIIFGTGLRVFERVGVSSDMFGRLLNLLDIFGLKKLTFGYCHDGEYSTVLIPEAKESYREEREKSLSFLKNALSVKELNRVQENVYRQ